MEYQGLGNSEIEREIGRRIRANRLNQNISQAELAEDAGVALRTITNLEKGNGCSLNTLIGTLRGLELLPQLERFIPDPGLGPIELAKLQGRKRLRATGKRGNHGNLVRETSATPWEWDDD